MNLSTQDNELDEEQFLTISIMIISHLLNGNCVKVKEHHDLPCRSYFSSNIIEHFGGVDGQISFERFEQMLETIGLGDESGHTEEISHEYHDHRRRKRDTSDNSVQTHNKDAVDHSEVQVCVL